ncbi:hypothetical protein [Caballeronia sp. LZ019]|uniref:hypothetical protein n=1 Tax=Caballeronia sp. LZ019 TaxID=3038555 RepID=UPI00285C6EBF|nr:hypothetical protein [Caballeronia sp. LZ019]MDR5809520.1 hypothetical protein [Caballeronia sp. LZ019]
MFHLGPYYGGYHDNPVYLPLFWPSLNQSLHLSVQHPGMFDPARHYAFGTDRHFTEITADEVEDITQAMKIARVAFLEGIEMLLLTCEDDAFRSILARSDESFPEWVWSEKRHIIQAVCDEIKKGRLVFVPKRDDLRACVEAMQKRRRERPAPVARTERLDPRPCAQRMYGKTPRVPQNVRMAFDAPAPAALDDAQPFEYPSGSADGGAFQIASQLTKTPNVGDAGTWYTNPGSGQMRLYGDAGAPVIDLDFDHVHNGLRPHAHNWNSGVRDGGDDVVPFSPWNP